MAKRVWLGLRRKHSACAINPPFQHYITTKTIGECITIVHLFQRSQLNNRRTKKAE